MFGWRSIGMLLVALMLIASGCTGGMESLPTRAGGIRISPGEQVHVDLQDIVALNPRRYNVILKTIGNDFRPTGDILDLTTAATKAIASGTTRFSFTLPKNTRSPRPFLLAVDLPELNESLVDVVFNGNASVRPGVASRLTFDLLDSYSTPQNPKPLQSYSESDFVQIRGIIQSRIDVLMSQSEKVSFSSLPYQKLMTFFRNGLAFNPWVLTSVKNFGVNFTFTDQPYPGIIASDTKDNSLSTCTREICFRYASDFKIGSNTAPFPPFKARSNIPAEIPIGQAIPMPGRNIATTEGICLTNGCTPKISLVAKPFDPEGDHIEKILWVKYLPRRLPESMRNRPTFDPAKEPAERSAALKADSIGRYLPVTDINLDVPDRYELLSIEHDEAISKRNYADSACAESGTPVFNDQCHTAYRDVFAMYTDGMVWMPYRWGFVYNDTNRKPEFIKNSQNGINSTFFDEAIQRSLAAPESDVVPGWKLHNSHCENDPNATPTPAAPPQVQPSGTPVINYFTRIQDKKDGPWSCAFLAFDPDIDQDPNGAPDRFYFQVTGRTMQTKIRLGGQISSSVPGGPTDFTQLPISFWPPPPPPATPRPPMLSPMEVTSCPGNHVRCGAALAQVTVDNAVKEQTPLVSFDIEVFDRPENGMFSLATAQRGVKFKPSAPLVINFSDPPSTRDSFTSITNYFPNSNGPAETMQLRYDAYMDEILQRADPVNPSAASIGFDPGLIGNANRANFKIQSLEPGLIDYSMSPYLTQPRSICSSANPTDNGTQCRGSFNVTLDPQLQVTQASPGTPVRMGNSLRFLDAGNYTHPREYDFSCGSNSGNNWNQMPTAVANARNTVGGWSFEVNFIDFDNINLNPDEPPETMYLSTQNNVRYADSLYFCTPPLPNTDSPTLGHVYTATNATGTNAKDPDQCLSLAAFPGRITLQPIPVLYEGRENAAASPSIRKIVYHRLRGVWRPRDQGLESKSDNQDPRGLLQNAFTQFKVFGRVHDLRLDNQESDFSQPIEFKYGRNVPKPVNLLARKREMLPCLTSSIENANQQISRNNSLGSEIRFSIRDENKTNYSSTTFIDAVRGYDEAHLQVLGTRSLADNELLKFIPYLLNCTPGDANAPSNTVTLTHQWNTVPGASGYRVSVNHSGGNLVDIPVTGNSYTVANLLPFQDVLFSVRAAYQDESLTPAIVSTYQTYPAAPVVGTGTVGPPSRPPVFTVASTDLVSRPFIRLRAGYNRSPTGTPQFCLRASAQPINGSGGVPFDTVWRVARSDANTKDLLSFTSAKFSACTDQAKVVMPPDAKALYFAVKKSANAACQAPIGAPVNLGDWNDPLNRITVTPVWTIDPTSPSFGSLTTPVILTPDRYNFDLFPSIFGRDSALPGAITASTFDEPNRILFSVRPINNFMFNEIFNSMPGFGRNTYVGAWTPTGVGETNLISASYFSSNMNLENRLPLVSNLEQALFSSQVSVAPPDIAISHADTDVQISKLTSPGSPDSGGLLVGDPDTYFRVENSNQTLALYVKPLPATNSPPRTIEIPFQALDTFSEVTPANEDDPYDVLTYQLNPLAASGTPVPQETPSLVGGTRGATCSTGPPNYPGIQSTLNLVQLQAFKRCSLRWRVFPQDVGKEFEFHLDAQDNLGATLTTPGVGGRGALNGLTKRFKVKIYSLEKNEKPFFTSSEASTVALASNAYSAGTSSSAWDSVFTVSSGATQAGLQPQCVSASSPYLCSATSGLSISPNDTLINTTPIDLSESSLQGQISPEFEIEIYAKDSASQGDLKKIVADPDRPTRGVLIAGGTNKGATYLVPSWSSLSLSEGSPSNYDINSDGIQETLGKKFTIKWRPTDEEARFLSNQQGFLIPFNIKDTAYVPGGSGAPTGFEVSAERATAWVWVRLRVRNHEPILSYFVNPGATPVPPNSWISLIDGETVDVQAGKSAKVRIRVIDPDHARVWAPNGAIDSSEVQSSYFTQSPTPYFEPINDIANFSSVQTLESPSSQSADSFMGLNDSNGRKVIRQFLDFTVSPPSGNSQVKEHQIKIHVRDPGDPTLDLALGGQSVDSSGNPKRVTLPTRTYTLKVNVTGRAGFLVPNSEATPLQITTPRSNLTRMNFRLSLNVTKPTDFTSLNSNKNFFMGLVLRGNSISSPNPIPVATPSAGQILDNSGFYVDHQYTLYLTKGSFNSSANIDQLRMLELGAIRSDLCASSLLNTVPGPTSPSTTTYPVVLGQINTSGTPSARYCYLTQTQVNDDLALSTLEHRVTSDLQFAPVPSTFARTWIDRRSRSTFTSFDSEFQDFYQRCRSFSGAAGYCADYQNGASWGIGMSGSTLTSGAPGGQVTYTNSNKRAAFKIESSTEVKKSVFDDQPSNTGNLETYALKGERMTFNAELDPAFTVDPDRSIFARWYVNGCLRQVDRITGTTLPVFELKEDKRSGGPQDNCTGKFHREGEVGADQLGLYLVRVALVNGGETTLNSLDYPTGSASANFLFKVRIVNTEPEVMTGSDVQGPLSQASVSLAIPFQEYGRNYIAFDSKDSAGQITNQVRIRTVDSRGTLQSNLTVNCAVSGSPRWLGVNPVSAAEFRVALLGDVSRWTPGLDLSTAYPNSDSLYSSATFGCYQAFSAGTVNGTLPPLSAGSSMVASTAALGKYSTSARATGRWTPSSSVGYLFDSENPSDINPSRTVASREFWSSTSLLQANPSCPNSSGQFHPDIFDCNASPYQNFPKNRVYKMLNHNSNLIQLLGPGPNVSSGAQGQVLIHSMVQSTNWGGLSARSAALKTITFGAVAGSTCVAPNTVLPFPVDATYDASSDTLYVITTDTSSFSSGYFMAVRNAVNGNNPTCSVLTTINKPSTDPLVNNTNVRKMVVDQQRGLVFALIAQDSSGSLVVYDSVTGAPPVIRPLGFSPLTLMLYDTTPSEPNNNLLMIMSRAHVSTSLTPSLYRVY